MEISFYLKRPKAEGKTSIFARISYATFDLKYYLPDMSIDPRNWNKEKKRGIQSNIRFPQYVEFNQRLSEFEVLFSNTIIQLTRENDTIPPAPEQLKLALDNIFRPKKDIIVKLSLNSFFSDFIERSKKGLRLNTSTGTPISKETIKIYNTAQTYFKQFQKYCHKTYDFKDIDLEFYEDFKEFLTLTLKLSTNTVGKQIKTLKTILNDATELGHNTNLAYRSKRFKRVTEEADDIYLTEDELYKLSALDLSNDDERVSYQEKQNGKMVLKTVNFKTLARARDLFLIGSYTGMRFSDFSNINVRDIKDGLLEFTQFKTKEKVVVPIGEEVISILDRNNGEVPLSMSNQKMNMYLKLIGAMIPVLHEVVQKKLTKGGKLTKKILPKYELISTHTARRSFATNEYNAGTPTITIRAITGHKDEKSFLKYIKATSTDHAKKLQELRELRKLSKLIPFNKAV